MNPYRLAAALLLVFQSLLVYSVAGDVAIPALAIVGAALCSFHRGWWRISWLPLLILRAALVLMAVLMTALDAAALGEFVDYETVWGIPLAQLGLMLQLVELVRLRDDTPLPWHHGTLAIVTLIGLFQSLLLPLDRGLQLTIALTTLGFVAVVQQGSRRSWATTPAWRLRLPVTSVLLFSLVALLTWQISDVVIQRVPQMQSWFSQRIAAAAGRSRGAPSPSSSATLSSVSLEKQTNPMGVALSVRSFEMPGYLRGSVYDNYAHGQWNMRRGRAFGERGGNSTTRKLWPVRVLSSVIEPRDHANVFELAEASEGPWSRLEIYSPQPFSRRCFLPLATEYLQGSATSLSVNRHDVIESGIQANQTYTAVVSSRPLPSRLEQPLDTLLLQIPTHLAVTVNETAATVLRDRRSTEQKIAAVENYFQSNYEYSLAGFEKPTGIDPLEYFLLRKPSAHCEFFASAAVLLLRSEGVPCRYVTGYTVTEQSSDGESWLARHRDAHAWVEAYDNDTGLWSIVEATPGVDVPKQIVVRRAEELADASANESTKESDAEASSWNLRELLSWTYYHIGDIAWWSALAGCLLAASWVVMRQFVASSGAAPPSARQQMLGALLARMNREVAKLQLARASHETLHQFADRLARQATEHPALREAAVWYRRYAAVIYGDAEPIEALLPLPSFEPQRPGQRDQRSP